MFFLHTKKSFPLLSFDFVTWKKIPRFLLKVNRSAFNYVQFFVINSTFINSYRCNILISEAGILSPMAAEGGPSPIYLFKTKSKRPIFVLIFISYLFLLVWWYNLETLVQLSSPQSPSFSHPALCTSLALWLGKCEVFQLWQHRQRSSPAWQLSRFEEDITAK